MHFHAALPACSECQPHFDESLVNFLLLIDTELSGSHVDQKKKTTNNREDLEKVVLCKVLVGMVGVEL